MSPIQKFVWLVDDVPVAPRAWRCRLLLRAQPAGAVLADTPDDDQACKRLRRTGTRTPELPAQPSEGGRGRGVDGPAKQFFRTLERS